jgi:hypothetical protein
MMPTWGSSVTTDSIVAIRKIRVGFSLRDR